MSKKRRLRRTWLIVGLLIAFLAGGAWLIDPMVHASRESTTNVQLGMPRKEVVDILGVMYDDYPIGKYSGVDAIAKKMNGGGSVTTVCHWRIAWSLEQFWVGFDAKGEVVDIVKQ